MKVLERIGRAVATPASRKASGPQLEDGRKMESLTHCAYNQTRECFLGLSVKAADIPSARVGDLMSARPLKSGEGVWMTPFRGIPAGAMPAPLDLIYLDEDCRVIDTVESFPTFQMSAGGRQPRSVLALPAHSIYTSQTQPGDQLLLCVAEEMGRQLQRLNSQRVEASETAAVAGAAMLREKPLWSGGPGVLELEDRRAHGAKARQIYEMDLTRPGARSFKQQRSWLQRWWSPDPRKAPRTPAPGVAAYYWNGAAPMAHGVRDISSSGLYMVTEERWYPGTLILMTLQQVDSGEDVEEQSVAVLSRAVRWGPDGVGLQFVLSQHGDGRGSPAHGIASTNRKELRHFLEQLKVGNKE